MSGQDGYQIRSFHRLRNARQRPADINRQEIHTAAYFHYLLQPSLKLDVCFGGQKFVVVKH